jgi:two-component system response regulator AtoC
MSFKILIVDDEIEVCRSLCEILTNKGYQTYFDTNPQKTARMIQELSIDLVLLDIKMPQTDGVDLVKILRSKYADLAIIIISGFATVETAVRAMRYGALNVYTKPIKITLLLKEIERIRTSFEQRKMVAQDSSLIVEDLRMKHIISLVRTAAPTDAPILITGESGTGKELVANSIHASSKRRNHPFIKINCASIPESLLESELFGYEKWAFTDAKDTKKGIFDLASGGSIFLDEIGDMSLNMQAKMLRVLQDGKFLRVGGTRFMTTNSRIIAATNKNLEELIKANKFREDLYYRLAVINIHIPPLRERKEDILPLANYFLSYFSKVYNKDIKGFSSEAIQILLNHSWPGNVRELKNFIERAVIFCCTDIVDLSVIPEQYHSVLDRGSPDNLYGKIEGITRETILDALFKSNGVKQEAARLLNIDRKTLYNRMKKLNIK